MGIAERQIHVKFDQKKSKRKPSKPLPANIQTIGNWIRVKRTEKNLTSGHVAAKMGIADAVIRSWENGERQPDARQMSVLAKFLGFYPPDVSVSRQD